MEHPLISIITVVYNGKPTLEATIQSVISQDKNLFEYWIIDGGSIDGSVDIIRHYEHQLAGWVSEHDKGIYDAMNKGISKTKGQWLYFLGADDALEPGIIAQLSTYLTSTDAMAYGDIVLDTGRRVSSFLNQRILLQNTVHHQGAFYRRSLFVDFQYNTQLRILSDYELNLKIYWHNLPTKRLPLIVARCKQGGASSNLSISLQETNSIRAIYLGDGLFNKGMSFLLRLYYAQKKIRKYVFRPEVVSRNAT